MIHTVLLPVLFCCCVIILHMETTTLNRAKTELVVCVLVCLFVCNGGTSSIEGIEGSKAL